MAVSSWLERYRPWAGLVFDWAVAVAAATISVALIGDTELAGTPQPYALALVHTLPLAWRRRHPQIVMAVVVATGLLTAVAGYDPVILGLALIVAVYTVAALASIRRALIWLGVVEAAVLFGPPLADAFYSSTTRIINGLVVAGVWLVGLNVGQWQRAALAHQQGAADQARRAVTAERLRIARELHDVVAHGMSVIAVQAGTGRLLLKSDPGTAARALQVIEATSRDALAEMRRLLDVLRDENALPSELAPAPRISDLDRLAAGFGESGLAVALRIDGTTDTLPPTVQASVYRIVQEALTNVLRHAPGAGARVLVRQVESFITMEITNDATVRAHPTIRGAGMGLEGIRERALAFGGTFDAGPTDSGGFRVAVSLPVDRRSPSQREREPA